jgi:hypothetical protein
VLVPSRPEVQIIKFINHEKKNLIFITVTNLLSKSIKIRPIGLLYQPRMIMMEKLVE